MKRAIFVVAALILSGCSSPEPVAIKGEVISCASITFDKSITKGATIECLDGSAGTSMELLRGPMIINVWGSWCEGCKQEMPYFVELYQSPLFTSGQIQMLGVNVEEKSKEDAIDYIQKSGMSWPNLEDTSGISKSIFGPGVPVTWFIDENGKNIETKIGAYTNKKQLFNQVEKAFGVKL